MANIDWLALPLSLMTDLPTTNVNDNNKALTVQAGEHYTKHDHEWGCGSSLRLALLGWHMSAFGDAAALDGFASTRSAHD